MKTAKGLGWSIPLLALLICTPLFAQGTFYGDSASMGHGIVRTWVTTGQGNVPDSIGVTFTAGVLQGLPNSGVNISMNLPRVASDSLFKHVYMNWEPQGHPPTPYLVPHFDIHFYVIPASQREAITATSDNVLVPPQFVPPHYSAGPFPYQVVPGMGEHFMDTTAIEFQGHEFTRTLVYGFYRGEFLFYEPMITLAYFQARPDSTFPIPQPEAYQRTGYYPTTYSVRWNQQDSTYTVSIGNFVFRNVGGAAVGDLPSGMASGYVLHENYPNPFNPSTSISYELPRAGHVTLKVYNLLGEEVATLVEGVMAEGAHTVQFDGKNAPSGMYFYRLQTDNMTMTRKMVLLK